MIWCSIGPRITMRLVAGRDVADGDGLDAVGQVGDDAVPWAHGGLLAGAHHQRNIGAVDVGVDEAYALAEPRERDGQVDGDGGFAYPAFAGTDGDDFETPGKATGEGMEGECAIGVDCSLIMGPARGCRPG